MKIVHRIRCNLERSNAIAFDTAQTSACHLNIDVHIQVGFCGNARKRFLQIQARWFKLMALDEYGSAHGKQKAMQLASLHHRALGRA